MSVPSSRASRIARRLPVLALAFAAGVAVAAPPQYKATRLLTPAGGEVFAAALDASGLACGYVPADATSNKTRAVEIGSHRYLTYRALGSFTDCSGIDSAGDTVGTSTSTRGVTGGAYLRLKSGTVVDLFDGQHPYSTQATGVNAVRTVVGYEQVDKESPYVAFAWMNGTAQTLPGLGGANELAMAVNDDGLIVGEAGTPDFLQHATTWVDGQVHDLGSIGAGGSSVAYAVSSRGWVAGQSSIEGNAAVHAALWHDGLAIDLGTLRKGNYSAATGVNASGTVVGMSAVDSRTPAHAFVWQDGAMTDLNQLAHGLAGWTLGKALAINDAGQILASGFDANGASASFLLTPARQ